MSGLKATVTHFGTYPEKIIIPYTAEKLQNLAVVDDDWAILVCAFSGTFDNHYPKNPILTFARYQPLVFPRVTSAVPLTKGDIVYTDGSKTGIGTYVHKGKVVTKQFAQNSPQLDECQVVLEVLNAFPGPVNIVSDSSYVVNAINSLEVAGLIKTGSSVASIFMQIQQKLLSRRSPCYTTHIRAHSGLPGPMSQGNNLADLATRATAFAVLTPVEAATQFHSLFHVTAETLSRRFSIIRKDNRDIVLHCGNCSVFATTQHVGVYPRGIQPLQV